MNVWIVIGGIVNLLILLFVLWKNKRVTTMLHKTMDELKFFKKEKEYYDEAMLLLSKEYTVIYANQAAKDIFSLDSNNETIDTSKQIQLQITSGSREDFFSVLSEYSAKYETSFNLENVFLYIARKEQKVNIFMDKSALDINGTMTCIIDLKSESQVPADVKLGRQDGTVDFLTSLPSQFQALLDINTLVIESKKKSTSFTIFLIGIEHFSDIQIRSGLGYSNKILKRIAQYFIDNQDSTMKLYKMDADKFLFVVNGFIEDERIKTIAKDISVSIDNIFSDSNDVRLTSRIGIVSYPHNGENATKLIDNAYVMLDKIQKGSKES